MHEGGNRDRGCSRVEPAGASQAGNQDRQPLAGIRVVEFGHYVAGPGIGMVLGSLGADVVKVEPVDGEATRYVGAGDAMIRGFSHSKRSIAVDLRLPAGRRIARDLVATADVLVQNMRQGTMERHGLGPTDVHAMNPRIIYVSVTGFGSTGPSRSRPGLDIAAQAESGMMSINGEPDRAPQRVGFPVVDNTTGHFGAEAVLAALLRRQQTGVGDEIEISLLEVALHLQTQVWAEYFFLGREPSRVGNGQPTNAPAADLVATRDGHIVLSAYTDQKWAEFCTLVGRAALAEDPRFTTNELRVRNRRELGAVLEEALGSLSTEEAVTWLSSNGVIAGAVRRFSEVMDTPDVKATGIFMDAVDEAGEPQYKVLGLPYRMKSVPRRTPMVAPRAGEDTEAILGELGYSRTDIERLVGDRIVRTAKTSADTKGRRQ